MVTLICEYISNFEYFGSNSCFDSHRYTFMLQEDFSPIDVLINWNGDGSDDAKVSMSIQNKLVKEWSE